MPLEPALLVNFEVTRVILPPEELIAEPLLIAISLVLIKPIAPVLAIPL